MRTARSLGLLFGSLLPLALAAPACGGEVSTEGPSADAGSSSGGSSSGDGGNTLPTFSETLCDGEQGYLALKGLQLAEPVDYLELRRAFGTEEPVFTIASEGESCAGASDGPACAAALGAARVDEGFERLPDSQPERGLERASVLYMVYTRGDTVGTIATAAELNALLGPTDTLKEAALQLTVRAHALHCPPTEPHSTGEALSGGGYRITSFSGLACGPGTTLDGLTSTVSSDGVVTIDQRIVLQEGDDQCAIGRRPDGLISRAARGLGLGAYFAEMAHLEAASVTAFAQIEHELELYDAPEHLREGARRARADEIRHAEATAAMAARFGGRVPAPEVLEGAPRDRFRFALDNAVEGCVRETFGALLAQAQAERASDPRIAAMLRTIAREETEHAAFSWSLAAWIEPGLDAAERAQIHAARQQALLELEASLARRYGSEVEREAGMPTPAQARALLAGLAPHLLGPIESLAA